MVRHPQGMLSRLLLTFLLLVFVAGHTQPFRDVEPAANQLRTAEPLKYGPDVESEHRKEHDAQ